MVFVCLVAPGGYLVRTRGFRVPLFSSTRMLKSIATNEKEGIEERGKRKTVTMDNQARTFISAARQNPLISKWTRLQVQIGSRTPHAIILFWLYRITTCLDFCNTHWPSNTSKYSKKCKIGSTFFSRLSRKVVIEWVFGINQKYGKHV